MSFPLEDLNENELIMYLERLNDEDLISYCDEPISKRMNKICEIPYMKDLVKKARNRLIEKAWSYDFEDHDPNVGETGPYTSDYEGNIVSFTGNVHFDYILTRMAQVSAIDDYYESGRGKCASYQDSMLFKLIQFSNKDLVSTLYKYGSGFNIDLLEINIGDRINIIKFFNGKNIQQKPTNASKWYIIPLFFITHYSPYIIPKKDPIGRQIIMDGLYDLNLN